MTKDEIASMNGHALRAAVAEKVMGWMEVQKSQVPCDDALAVYGTDQNGWQFSFVPRYEADIATAWQVVEKMTMGGERLSLLLYPDGWRAWFGARRCMQDSSPAVAICRAALLAVHAGEKAA